MIDDIVLIFLCFVFFIIILSKITIKSQNDIWCVLFGHPHKFVDIEKYNDKQWGYCTRCETKVTRNIHDTWIQIDENM